MKALFIIFVFGFYLTVNAEKWKGEASYYTHTFNGFPSTFEDCFFDIQFPRGANGEFVLKINFNPQINFKFPVKNMTHPATDSAYNEDPVNYKKNQYNAYTQLFNGQEWYQIALHLEHNPTGYKVTGIDYNEFSLNQNRVNKFKGKNDRYAGPKSRILSGRKYNLVQSRYCIPRIKLQSY